MALLGAREREKTGKRDDARSSYQLTNGKDGEKMQRRKKGRGNNNMITADWLVPIPTMRCEDFLTGEITLVEVTYKFVIKFTRAASLFGGQKMQYND